jgi:hypothetical protein
MSMLLINILAAVVTVGLAALIFMAVHSTIKGF